MRKQAIGAIALFAAAMWGQDASRVYRFTNFKTPQGYQEVASVIRSTADIRDVTVDAAAQSLTTNGTVDQMALTDWLFPELEQPDSREYQMTGTGGVVRVFHLAHAASPREVQEMVNIVRITGDVNRVFPVSETKSMVVRGTTDQMQLTEWLVSQLDIAAPTPGAPVQARQFADLDSPEVRVVHLAHTTTPAATQELVNALRAIADVQRIFPYNTPGIIVMRGSAESVAVGLWMLGQLDQPAGGQGPAPHEQPVTTPGENVARVFYLSHAGTVQALQSIAGAVRGTAAIEKAFPCSQPNALAVRGSTDQMKQAAALITQLDK